MNTFFKTLGLVALLAFTLTPGFVRAQDEQNGNSNISQAGDNNAPQNGDTNVSFQTFYDQLASQGTWIQTDQYGYVFQPTESDPNWRPYTYGHWVNTDAGMSWVSNEPFGWATDHYGRWVNLDGYGWVWVPGYTWAPAWVSWRDGDDDVGWAPLPPDSDVGIDFFDDYFDWGFGFFGFHIGNDCDLAYGIGPWCYNFCPVAYIGDPDCWRHFRDRRDNFALIDHTRNVTNINFHRDGAGQFGRVTTEGPSVAALNARSRTPIEHVQLTSASRLGNAGLRGDTLAVYAPRIDPATVKTARPESVGRTLANTSVNRGTDINRPLAVNSRIRPASPTAEQIHAATLAQSHMPANAKVATTDTRISRPLTRPLSSLRTDTRSTSIFGGGASENTAMGATRAAAPSVSTESRYTGEPVTRHTSAPSSEESIYTGEAAGPQVSVPSRTTSTFSSVPSYSSGESYHPSRVFHTSAPLFRSSAPSYYHPQQSFRSFAPAPQPHFNGGGFRGGAPAAHFSGGSFGGGGRSYGGGVHASGGGGQSGNGGRH